MACFSQEDKQKMTFFKIYGLRKIKRAGVYALPQKLLLQFYVLVESLYLPVSPPVCIIELIKSSIAPGGT